MQKTLRRSDVMATMPTIASFLFIFTMFLWIDSSVCCAASKKPVHSSQNKFIAPGTDWGSSSRHARRRAEEALPLHKMAKSDQLAIQKSLQSTTLYRRLPVELFACDGNLLGFSLDKPEAIVDIWRLLGISRLSLDPTGPDQWQFADGYGTVGQLRLAYRERRQHGGMLVFHGKGAYTGPLSPKNLTGGCVLMVRYREAEPTVDGRLRQAIQVDAFLDMDGIGLEIVTRTLQPLIARSAAANLHEICLFMASLSDAALANPHAVATLAGRLTRTSEPDRKTLAAIASSVGTRRHVQHARANHLADNESKVNADQVSVDLASRWLPSDELDHFQKQ
jgi:hypothetical protein